MSTQATAINDNEHSDPCKMAEPLSDCCDSPPIGEVEMGLCGHCRDHCSFHEGQPEEDRP